MLLGRVRDDADEILALVRRAVAGADLVLISGGSSAGARDLTRAVVESLGEPGLLFHGVAVRPGKPTVVGAHRGVPVFGLPGHPISAMVIFLVLVRPLLERLLGIPPGEGGVKVLARLTDNLPSQAGREDYYQVALRPAAGGMEAVPVFRKSGLVTAMVRGRGMVRVAPEREGLEVGRTRRGRPSRMSDGGGRGRRYLRRLGADEARRLLFERLCSGVAPHRASETVPTPEALGRVTAAAVGAHHPAPFYHSSAMDGIALAAERTYAASETAPVRLAVPGDAFWVDTGDPIPQGCSVVVPSEELHWREDGSVEIHGPSAPWEHVRVTGQEIATGEMVLPSGWLIGPADIGSLLAAGLTQVAVAQRPWVLVLPTGTELIRPGAELEIGKVVEFNSEVAAGMVRETGGVAVIGEAVPDDLDRLRAAIREGAAVYDIVVVLAGSSAGSEDFTPRAIELEGELIAHGINIAPGKPTALGIVGGKPVIGLPGFPVAAIVAARLFLAPLVRLLLGLPEPVAPRLPAVLPRALPSRLDVREFIRVRLGRVGQRTFAYPLPRGSAAIFSWTKAQGLVVIPEAVEGLEAGAEVSVEIIREMPDLERTVVLIGSHDLLIDVLEDELRARGVTLLASATGSLGGSARPARRRGPPGDLAPDRPGERDLQPHLRDQAPRAAGDPAGRARLAPAGADGRPGQPEGGSRAGGTWGATDVSFVNRQKGSGSRVLLDYRLAQAGIAPEQVRGYRREEYTHWAVAMAVQSGLTDCGLGIYSAAATMGLDFIPLEEEEFDLLIPEEHMALPAVQALLETTASERFRSRVLALGGYRFR